MSNLQELFAQLAQPNADPAARQQWLLRLGVAMALGERRGQPAPRQQPTIPGVPERPSRSVPHPQAGG